jgi:hypothetical protein
MNDFGALKFRDAAAGDVGLTRLIAFHDRGDRGACACKTERNVDESRSLEQPCQ